MNNPRLKKNLGSKHFGEHDIFYKLLQIFKHK